jgi:basic membrane lipoprotein Med (substrate-binding protein (PBP1-ABC) superfamily)
MSAKKFLYFVSVLVIVGLVFSACATAPQPTESEPVVIEPEPTTPPVVEPTAEAPAGQTPKQVQFCAMYSTSITENGWDRSGYESFERFMKNPGMDIEVLPLKFTEGLYGDEADAAMRAFAESGCDILWGHGGYNDILIPISADYPDVMFVEIGSGLIEAGGNHYHYMNRCYDGSYLMGVLAGLMTQGTAIGAVGGFPAEDVNDNINGFFEGAKSVNPELKQKASFINSWYDPVAAGELAEAQKAAGADMLYMLAENFDVCGEGKNAMCFGPYIDFSEFYPGAVMASFLTTWDPAYEWALKEWVKAKETGVWDGKPYGFENSMISGACTIKLGAGIEESLPADVLAQYNATYEGIMNGSIVPTKNIEEPGSE